MSNEDFIEVDGILVTEAVARDWRGLINELDFERQALKSRVDQLEAAAPSVEAVPGGYVVQCRDGGFGRVHETEQAARESIQRGGGSGNIRPVFVGSAPTPPASAGGLDKEAIINWAEQKLDICDRPDEQLTYRSFIYRIKRGDFDLKKSSISKTPEIEIEDDLSLIGDKQMGGA